MKLSEIIDTRAREVGIGKFARKCGVPPQTLDGWRKGARPIRSKHYALSLALGVPEEEITRMAMEIGGWSVEKKRGSRWRKSDD